MKKRLEEQLWLVDRIGFIETQFKQIAKHASDKPYKKLPHPGLPSIARCKELLPVLKPVNTKITALKDLQDVIDNYEFISSVNDLYTALFSKGETYQIRQLKHQLKKSDYIIPAHIKLEMMKLKEQSITREDYLKLVKVAHPDKGGNEEAMKVVSSIYSKDTAASLTRLEQEIQKGKDTNEAKRTEIQRQLDEETSKHNTHIERMLDEILIHH